MRKTEVSGSVRVDLLGGTLDLNPINLILPEVVTLNLATSLKARVMIEEIAAKQTVEIFSQDYNKMVQFSFADFSPANLRQGHFKELGFVAWILAQFPFGKSYRVTLASGSPPGAGLGGSSAMGVVLYSALCQFHQVKLDRQKAISVVNALEARILEAGPAGYQDYYPALYGGVLALLAAPGEIVVEQCFSPELKRVLEAQITLVYSGETRLSGINNWEVYKSFFDKKSVVQKGLREIAQLSYTAYQEIKLKQFKNIPSLIAAEGSIRKELFPGIITKTIDQLYNKLAGQGLVKGMKVCGAGGGGCFLLVHDQEQKAQLDSAVVKMGMQILPFVIESPI